MEYRKNTQHIITNIRNKIAQKCSMLLRISKKAVILQRKIVEIHKKTLKIVHLIPAKEESIFQHRTDGTDAFDTLEALAEIRNQRQKMRVRQN